MLFYLSGRYFSSLGSKSNRCLASETQLNSLHQNNSILKLFIYDYSDPAILRHIQNFQSTENLKFQSNKMLLLNANKYCSAFSMQLKEEIN